MGNVEKPNEALMKVSNVLNAKMGALVGLGCQTVVAERIKTIFLLQCRKTPKLLKCSVGSLVQAFTDAGTIGLEPDGIHAHLIPYGTECTYMVDYKGYIRLAKESGEIADMTANVVRANDEFEHEYGSNKHLKHIKAFGTDKERGKRIAAYSYVRFKDGSEDFRVLTEDEIMHAKKSSKTNNVWTSDPDPMWAKTAVRQHAKFLPSQKKLQLAADIDERRELREIDISEVAEAATDDNKENLKQKIAEKQKAKATGETKAKKPEPEKPKAETKPPEQETKEPPAETKDFKTQFNELVNANGIPAENVKKELEDLGYESVDDVKGETDQGIVLQYFRDTFEISG